MIGFLSLASSNIYSQVVTVKMLNGKEIKGILISMSVDRISIDPDGSVTFLSLASGEMESVTFPDGVKLTFPITDDQIPPKYKFNKEQKIKDPESRYYKNYYETYFFGGFSSKKTVMEGVLTDGMNTITFDMIYKNGGLGGIGLSWMNVGKNRRPDIVLDYEVSFYGASMYARMNGSDTKLLNGLAICMDLHFSIFPIKARNKYPSPFLFAGLGARIIGMSAVTGGSASSSEIHGEIPFGLGVRQKVSRVIAFQIKERFVYSKLKDVGGFILPETRFEMYITFGKN